jgi:hypothetical protein
VNGFAFSNSMGLSPAPAQANGRCCHLARPHRGRRQGLQRIAGMPIRSKESGAATTYERCFCQQP